MLIFISEKKTRINVQAHHSFVMTVSFAKINENLFYSFSYIYLVYQPMLLLEVRGKCRINYSI